MAGVSSWAMQTTSAVLLVDMGKSTGKEHCYFEDFDTEGSLVATCAAKRKPPILPDEFDIELKDKGFTNGSTDHPLVAKLYRAAFEQRFESVTELIFANLDWGDKEVGQADPGVEV